MPKLTKKELDELENDKHQKHIDDMWDNLVMVEKLESENAAKSAEEKELDEFQIELCNNILEELAKYKINVAFVKNGYGRSIFISCKHSSLRVQLYNDKISLIESKSGVTREVKVLNISEYNLSDPDAINKIVNNIIEYKANDKP